MFITVKRHEREKQELIGASNRLTDAILKQPPRPVPSRRKDNGITARCRSSLACCFDARISPISPSRNCWHRWSRPKP
jgi:hypothetical protein